MNKQQWCTLALALPLCAAPAAAETVMVPASADSIVNANDPNAVLNNSTTLLATKLGGAFGTTGVVSDDLRFFYAQFQLPGGLTGQDIQSVNDVQLKLTRSSTANFRLNYYVYGVFDGLDTASADTYSWNSGVGFDPSHNEVRFGTPEDISYYSDPAKSAFVGNIRTANDEGPNAPPNPPISVHGPFDFTIEAQSPTAVANMHDLILNDMDGRLTFYVGISSNFGVATSNLFASLEDGTFDPPTLCIDFVRIPEPSSLLLSTLGVAAIGLLTARKSL